MRPNLRLLNTNMKENQNKNKNKAIKRTQTDQSEKSI